MSTLIKNGISALPDCSGYTDANILIEDGYISSVGEVCEADAVIDADGKYLLPGFIDIHNHGSIGIYYADDSTDFEKFLRFYASKGVTTVLPTLGTNTVDDMVKYITNIVSAKRRGYEGARIGGIHLEGPFISSEKRGAMAVKSPPCTLESFNRMLDAGEGEIKLMAIAPERENALDVIREAVRKGVRISLGHTMATYAEAMAAIEAGLDTSVYIYSILKEKTGFSKISGGFNCSSTVSSIAEQASVIFDAYAKGDSLAKEIIHSEMKSLARIVKGVCPNGGVIAACGGMNEYYGKITLPILKEYIPDNIKFILPELPPIYGACREACRRFGVVMSYDFFENFANDYKSLIL